jgi:hypothetical protein
MMVISVGEMAAGREKAAARTIFDGATSNLDSNQVSQSSGQPPGHRSARVGIKPVSHSLFRNEKIIGA